METLSRFTGKTIIVTGGTSGLGEAIVHAFTREGGEVYFCGLIDSEGARVEAETKNYSGRAYYLHADVRDEAAVKDFVAKATGQQGKLDIAVNNAGISHKAARFADHDPSVVEDVWRTNVMGIWNAMRQEIPLMIASGGGAIINIASILSKSGAAWMAPYGMSKHAVVGMTKSASQDYADVGLRINTVSPGPMQTPMFERALADIAGDLSKFAGGIPKAGPTDPASVAQTVLYLASDEAKNITGANLTVDSGVSSG
jgi:NAD(P)-dependent dehydrogenase (short-subunit alcohol dehydrogenase family)